MRTVYLVTPKSTLDGFVFASDRAYFSKPVAVQPLYCDVATRLVYVRDVARDQVYPVDKQYLRAELFLTNKQRQQIAA